MKRNIFALGLLSLACAAFFVGESQAWHFWHHHRYATHITCRPYNAFTPMCWGNLTCDGCCPSFGCGGNQMPMTMGAPCFGGACAAAPANGPVMPPAAGGPNFTPPPPMPLPMGPNTTMYQPMNLSQVGYYPMYPQYYMPQYPMPNYGYGYSPYMNMHYAPAPGYWYGQ